MAAADATPAPTIIAKLLPRNGLLAVTCPHCHRHHFHTRHGLTAAPCGGLYRVRVEDGAASDEEAKAIRRAVREGDNARSR